MTGQISNKHVWSPAPSSKTVGVILCSISQVQSIQNTFQYKDFDLPRNINWIFEKKVFGNMIHT